MTPSERQAVEQALEIADKMNDFVVSQPFKVPARIQFIAHIIAALGLARVNGIDYTHIRETLHKMHHEMNRTARDLHEAKKPKLRAVPAIIKKEIE